VRQLRDYQDSETRITIGFQHCALPWAAANLSIWRTSSSARPPVHLQHCRRSDGLIKRWNSLDESSSIPERRFRHAPSCLALIPNDEERSCLVSNSGFITRQTLTDRYVAGMDTIASDWHLIGILILDSYRRTVAVSEDWKERRGKRRQFSNIAFLNCTRMPDLNMFRKSDRGNRENVRAQTGLIGIENSGMMSMHNCACCSTIRGVRCTRAALNIDYLPRACSFASQLKNLAARVV